MRRMLVSALGAGILVATHLGGAEAMVANPGFEDALTGWHLAPGDPSMVTVGPVEGAEGNALHLHAHEATLGIDADPLAVPDPLDPAKTYQVSARLKFGGLQSGVAAFSVCMLDSARKRLAQYSIASWNTHSRAHGWVTRSALVGAGSDKPFPEGTRSMHLRVSFYEKTGNCGGDIWADAFRIAEAEAPRFAGWPASIVVDCGDVQVRFESRSFWTLYRIDYKGTRICKDQFGSHYGTVASVKGVGFIGSGHTENAETEMVEDLELEVDGRILEQPGEHYSADTVVLRKTSRIRDLELTTTVTVADNRILEDVLMEAGKPMDLTLLYHFMHPWVTDMSDYAAEGTTGEPISGSFQGDKGMKVSAPVRWSAVYSQSLGKGAVTVVLDVPDALPWNMRYWDVPERYRKQYMMVFANAVVPAGKAFRYRALTIPFEADAHSWSRRAQDLSEQTLSAQ